MLSAHNKARHIRTKHRDLLPKGVLCSFCSAEVADGAQLQLHHRTCPGLAKPMETPSSALPPLPEYKPATPVAAQPSSSSKPAAARKRVPARPCTLDRRDLHAACEPFVAWLGESPEFEFERALKTALLLTDRQQEQPRADLCFAMRFADSSHLPTVLEPDNVQRFLDHMEQSGKGVSRKYALCHVLRKALAFLFSSQSRAANAVISPSTHSSWKLLDQYAHRWGKKRKLEQRDRAVFGSGGEAPMTAEEMTKLQRGCLEQMDAIERQYGGLLLLGDGERWQKYLITMLLVVLVAPRSQTISAMSTETVLPPGAPSNPSATQWFIRISATQNKAGQPVMLLIPDLLTPRMTVLFQRVLPKGHTGALFLKRSRKGTAPTARTEFGDITAFATSQLLGRSINPHLFRHSVATALSERADVDEALMRGAAQVMTHSSEVQSRHYVQQKRLKVSGELQGRLMEGVVAVLAASSSGAQTV